MSKAVYNPETRKFNMSLNEKYFISYDRYGKMLRRGRVIRKGPAKYLVGLWEVWTGIFLGETRHIIRA
jgi:hypothetical protein